MFQRGTNIGLPDGLKPLVINAGNNRLFLNDENYGFPVWLGGAILNLRMHIIETPHLPQRVDIALDRFDAVGIAWVRGNPGSYRISFDAPVTDEVKPIDDVLGLGGRWRLLSRERIGSEKKEARAYEQFESCSWLQDGTKCTSAGEC
jgi:hypothetical protein